MRYRDIVFMQDSEGREVCDTLELFGTRAAFDHLMQWEHGDNDGELRDDPPWGSRDNTETFGEYVMAWNHGLGYVGLVRLEDDDDDDLEPHNNHRHEYRTDIADWWCHDCDTVTDYCDGD